MAEYIDKQAFLEGQRHLYCENCAKRKGMKRGKMQFVYEIGDAPCRACGYGDVLDDLEDFPAADVRPVVRGKWIESKSIMEVLYCSECGFHTIYGAMPDGLGRNYSYCPNCGADMREES